MEKKIKKGKELAEMEEKLFTYEGEDKIISSIELAKELEKTDESIFRVSTGIPEMDRILNCVEAGEMIAVTGPTGEGKTTLLMTITSHMAKAQINTVWFTLEVTPRQFLSKLKMGSDEMPLFYLPSKNTDNQITWLEERIIEAKVKYNAQVVFIDHLHQIYSMAMMDNSRNFSLEIGDLAAKIKSIALEHNVTIFLITHSKDDPQGSSREPRKEDIRDSGLISRLADSIIGVWRIPNNDDGHGTRRKEINEDDIKTKVRVFKNRREGTMGWFVMYHDKHILWTEEQMTDRKGDEPF